MLLFTAKGTATHLFCEYDTRLYCSRLKQRQSSWGKKKKFQILFIIPHTYKLFWCPETWKTKQ